MNSIDEPTFFVVHAARAGYDDFTIEGVFSKDEDAKELMSLLEKSEFVEAVSPAQRVPMKTVIDMLVKDRLKELAKPIEVIAQFMALPSSVIAGSDVDLFKKIERFREK